MHKPIDIVESENLKSFARTLGFQSVGVGPAVPAPNLSAYEDWIDKGYHGSMEYLARQITLKSSPQELLAGARSVIAVSLNYNQKNAPVDGHPRIARYALGRDYHKVLRGKLRKLAAWVEERHLGSQTRACVDSAPILERDYAQLSGLGWYGKNTCLIDSRRGSWFFIGLLITTVNFKTDQPAVGGCGSCNKCVEACPTGAIIYEDARWQLDARRCISYLTIEKRGPIDPVLAEQVGDWTFGCDVCQEVCPFNEPRAAQPLRGVTTEEAGFLAHKRWPTLKELAVIQEGDWDRLTQGSSVRRVGASGLRRNALINLNNRT